MTSAGPSFHLPGAWLINIPALELHVSTGQLQRLVRWLDDAGCDVGAELSEAVALTLNGALPLTAAPCRWAGCRETGIHRVTVNTVNGDMDYDVCTEHRQLITP